MSSQSDLESKASRVLVVGGSCAIGRAVARSFACDGWKVTTTYRACNPLNETDSDTCSLDLMWDRGAMDAFVEFDRAKHGGKCPNVVVVCAAGIEPVALGSIDVDLFEKHYHTIVRGPLFLIQALYPHLEPDSRIILFSSALARTSCIFDDRYAVYASAKAACEQLVKYLSKPLAARQVTINAIAPGPIDTPGLRAQGQTQGGPSSATVKDEGEAHVERLAAMAPAKRIGTTDEVAASVRFLASNEASWITGTILNVSGGMCV